VGFVEEKKNLGAGTSARGVDAIFSGPLGFTCLSRRGSPLPTFQNGPFSTFFHSYNFGVLILRACLSKGGPFLSARNSAPPLFFSPLHCFSAFLLLFVSRLLVLAVGLSDEGGPARGIRWLYVFDTLCMSLVLVVFLCVCARARARVRASAIARESLLGMTRGVKSQTSRP
jgi:hypothetical protein